MKMADSLVTPMDQMRIQRHKTAPCSFQRRKHLHSIDETSEPVEVNEENKNESTENSSDAKEGGEEKKSASTDNKETLHEEKTEKTPAIMLQLRKKMVTNSFISRTRAAVARRKRLEQPWMKGPEMRPFFHLWEQSQCTPKGRKLKRYSSLPRDYKMPAVQKHPLDPGIIRECCCKIRSRCKTFPFD